MVDARCQRCGFSKKTQYDGEKCPRCGSIIMHMPIWINGSFM
ncbi:MAG TPA: hypothetical protein VJI12_00770 [archaeon]|nr:hypothetical protein [archaeon]